jgi:hypothetical protein
VIFPDLPTEMRDHKMIITQLPIQLDRPLNRSTAVYFMNETLARAHMRERMKHAEHERILSDVLAARRLQRRAERAARRARKLAHAAGVALSRVS